jgi:exonuclease SbcC
MINKIRLINFQSHFDTELEFHPGFNLIVGASDQGKSSILRALEWVRTNRPKGSNFVQTGQKNTQVTVYKGNNEIVRQRDLRTNGEYRVNGDVYSSMGTDVPDAVTNALNLRDINIQLQLDGHFLILDSPGKAAVYLNSVTKLDTVTNGLTNLRSRKRKNGEDIEQVSEYIHKQEAFLSSGILDSLKRLEEIQQEVMSHQTERFGLSWDSSRIMNLLNKIDEAENDNLRFKHIPQLQESLKIVGELIKEYGELNHLNSRINSQLSEYKRVNDNIAKLDMDIADENEVLIDIKLNMKECPYCGSKLDEESRSMLLGE